MSASQSVLTGESQTYIELGVRSGFLAADERTRLLRVSDSVGRLLNGLYRALRKCSKAKLPRPQP